MRLDTFINRPVLSTVISIFIVILGCIGLTGLPVEQYPNIAPPTVNVSTTYTGANAQTVLNSVIAPLEEAINGALNMQYMTSEATNNGNASINIYFKQGYNPDMAAIDVQNRVSQATNLLPAEVTRVGVTTRKRQTSMLVGVTLSAPTDEYDMDFIENYMAINVLPQIKRVPGVGEAFVMGTDYSMRVWLKPDVMAQYNLQPSDVSAALADQNIEAAPGQFGEQGNQSFQYVLRYKGRLKTPEEFEDIVVRADNDGNVLYLKDVADIELGRLTYGFQNLVNGHVGVTAIVFQSPGSNATEIIKDVLAQVKECEKVLPKGLEFNIPMNTDVFLQASIHELIKTLIEAFILVFIVVYVFLQDFRSTLIPAIAIPVALIGTFAFIYLIGFSLNLLTLAALVLAIAIVVDDAIVVVEAVHAKLDEGYKSSRQASIDAMSEIGSAIISITLVMMLVFIPVSFMPGTEGVFYRQFGITMAISIGLSAINALTLSPALCALFLKPHSEDVTGKKNFVERFHIAFNAGYNRLLSRYNSIVSFFIKAKALVWVIVIASVGALLWLMNNTSTGLVPDEDTGSIMGIVNMPPATSQERTMAVLTQVDSIIASIPAVENRTVIQGYSFMGGQGNIYGSMIIKLKDWKDRNKEENVGNIINQLYGMTRAKIKDGQVMFFAPPMISGYGASNGFELQLQDRTGGDINRFFEVQQSLLGALNKRPEIQMAYSSFNPTFPQYMVDVDNVKCIKAGTSTSAVLSVLQGYYGGMYVSNFNRFGKMYRVMMQASSEARVSPETLNGIKVRTPQGMTPITNFISIKRVYGPDLLSRFNLFTSIKVSGTSNPAYSSGQTLTAIQEVCAQVLPQGYSYEFSGLSREEAKNAESTTGIIFILCLMFVYLILSAQYESYILPLVVILSVPFGLMGSFIFAKIFGVANNIYLKISLIMLIGLLAKNAILIVEFALGRRKQGMSIIQAAAAGASARLRPILMTSLAMIIGLLPLMFASGVGANGNRTLGTGAVGGMLIGMILQVIIVPGLFVMFETLQEKFKPINRNETNEK
ncbi:MAG: efflux RND transporter permease subunit [Muribaculaceae bacterium]|nr:efflux RND transporter permease subunit [Muribaculaceae bacterium]